MVQAGDANGNIEAFIKGLVLPVANNPKIKSVAPYTPGSPVSTREPPTPLPPPPLLPPSWPLPPAYHLPFAAADPRRAGRVHAQVGPVYVGPICADMTTGPYVLVDMFVNTAQPIAAANKLNNAFRVATDATQVRA